MSKPEQEQVESSRGIEIEGQAEVIEGPGGGGQSQSRMALVLSVLALLAIAAGMFMGYRYWSGMKSSLEHLDAALSLAGREQRQMSEQLAQAQQSLLQQQKRLAAQDQALEAYRQQVETEREQLRQTGDSLNRSLIEMQQRLGNEKTQWRVAEAEYLMRLANHRLSLMADPATALEALKSADARLRDTNDPGWSGVREQLAKEILALEALPQVDREGLFARLGALADQVDQLPLKDEGVSPANRQAQAEDEPVTQEQATGFSIEKMLGDLWQGFKSMMVIRHHDKPITAMLPPEQRYFLGQNLRLKLEAAKAALMGGNAKLYAESLTGSMAWAERYFESASSQVKGFIGQLQGLAEEQISPALPDITGSLRALHKRREEMLQGGAS